MNIYRHIIFSVLIQMKITSSAGKCEPSQFFKIVNFDLTLSPSFNMSPQILQIIFFFSEYTIEPAVCFDFFKIRNIPVCISAIIVIKYTMITFQIIIINWKIINSILL